MSLARETFVVVIRDLKRHFSSVLRPAPVLLIACAVLTTAPLVEGASGRVEGRVKKVLPHLLDEQGRHTVSPSLLDRDAYQARLRKNPGQVLGVRYDVLWKARRTEGRTLTLRVELRGLFEGKLPRAVTLEKTWDGRASQRRWTGLELTGDAYRRFGAITAWRVTLWCDDMMLDEYRSFLW